MAKIFVELLKVEAFDIDNNFVALGGDSLTGNQVATRLRAMFGIELSNGAIFRKPTVAELMSR